MTIDCDEPFSLDHDAWDSVAENVVVEIEVRIARLWMSSLLFIYMIKQEAAKTVGK